MFEMGRRARLGVAVRLGYHRTVPELLKKRGWPLDEDLVVVLASALACKAQEAGGTRFRRPVGADGLPGLWPIEETSRTASRIIESLELTELIEPR